MTFDSPSPPGQSGPERLASEAQKLDAFHNFNLTGMRDAVKGILGLIGRDGLFREYTLHDISHIDGMLDLVAWLVPDDTRAAMTPADWLLLVLGVYLHDAGLVVTKAEFDARSETDFREFCEAHLFSGPGGAEYQEKVAELGDDADRFLYEEFVRKNHADRIADWILGRGGRRRGVSQSVVDELTRVLGPLPDEFKRDLALVCQSHHLSDLNQTSKYKVSQPYGNSDAETANVQYAALLLRTADLLQITQGRAPALLYRLIDPQDPVSQREWAKQAVVRRVRPQKGRDAEGLLSEAAPRSVVEVFATFTSPDGFFGLTSYLHYAGRELAQTYDWAKESQDLNGHGYSFPWRRIDDREVLATGFLPERLGFSLDQDKILDLLTGHTLYNDTSVVIREIVQNALDACRLQAHATCTSPAERQIEIAWDSQTRVLSVRDDGTGMSQEVIERNLLKAGASRYQEETFRARFPKFSSISRFGIGVLSTFMIADSVTITTCSELDEEARQLTLRSVHGRYLVELLEKDSDRAKGVFPHGTDVRLRVRASAELPDVLRTLRYWVVVPDCKVSLRIDGAEPINIGFESVGDALRDALESLNYDVAETEDVSPGPLIRVIETTTDGASTAFAVAWSPYFREWSFVPARDRVEMQARHIPLGTCVEGIRVVDTTPGFDSYSIMAMCNATGLTAPKTNVARSGLEQTPERAALLRSAYSAYLEHAVSETKQLVDDRGMSLTWAAQEASEIVSPLVLSRMGPNDDPIRVTDRAVFDRELRNQPLILVEDDGVRRLVAAIDLDDFDTIWTVDSEFVRAAERLLREVNSTSAMTSLASGLGSGVLGLPGGPLVAGYRHIDEPLPQAVLNSREVTKVRILRDERRIDLGWTSQATDPYWVHVDNEYLSRLGGAGHLLVGRSEIEVEGRRKESAVRTGGHTYLFADTAAAQYLIKLHTEAGGRTRDETFAASAIIVFSFLQRWKRPADVTEFVSEWFERSPGRRRTAFGELVDAGALVEVLEQTSSGVFDTSAWSRRPIE